MKTPTQFVDLAEQQLATAFAADPGSADCGRALMAATVYSTLAQVSATVHLAEAHAPRPFEPEDKPWPTSTP